jgi:hypothetical protein
MTKDYSIGKKLLKHRLGENLLSLFHSMQSNLDFYLGTPLSRRTQASRSTISGPHLSANPHLPQLHATSCQTPLKHSPRSIITPYVHRSEHRMKVPKPSDWAGSLTPRLSVGRCATAKPSVMRGMPPAEDEGECIVLCQQ